MMRGTDACMSAFDVMFDAVESRPESEVFPDSLVVNLQIHLSLYTISITVHIGQLHSLPGAWEDKILVYHDLAIYLFTYPSSTTGQFDEWSQTSIFT